MCVCFCKLGKTFGAQGAFWKLKKIFLIKQKVKAVTDMVYQNRLQQSLRHIKWRCSLSALLRLGAKF